MNSPTASQEPLKTAPGGVEAGVVATPPPKLLLLALVLILAVAGGVVVGLQAILATDEGEPYPSLTGNPLGEMPWLGVAISALMYQPVHPNQREVLPAGSITLKVTTPRGNVLSWSLTTASGKWERAQGPTELEIRLTSGAAEDLRPTLEKFVAGGKFSAGEQSALAMTYARLNAFGGLEMTRRNL